MCSVKDGGSFPVGESHQRRGVWGFLPPAGRYGRQRRGRVGAAVPAGREGNYRLRRENNPIYAPLTPEDQALQSNSTEVMASLWNGTGWETTRLTENGTPDLAPVAATNGGKRPSWPGARPSPAATRL